ncbi:methyltransferase domain-containing protein [Clostridium sediminicola]|uniref:MerR family transcriptional regulator n=1 Tax=Clostridium sediminicola TaxID=3114879 RepID=UPI0031F21663
MRIGQFAQKNKISIDTVRHYMDLGLIIAEKQGGQYFFDTRCEQDLEDIFTLKGMGFTLHEIKNIFIYRRLSKSTPYQKNEYYKSFFTEKYLKIEEEINELKNIKERLKNKIQELSLNENEKNTKLGVDLSALNILKCLKCGEKLTLSEGQILDNSIIDGKLKCDCGEEYSIEAGILIVNNTHKQSHFKMGFDYINEYISETDVDYLDNIYKSIEWMSKRISGEFYKNKILLELGSGSGFNLRNLYDELPQECLYIAVDHDIGRHKFLKAMLESTGRKSNILFICADFLEIPINDKSIDVLMDYWGTSNYSFDNEEFLLNKIEHYCKDNCSLLASYAIFKNFSANSILENKYRKNYSLQNIKKNIENLKFKKIDDKALDYLERGGKYENFFVEGEKVYSYMYYGKR